MPNLMSRPGSNGKLGPGVGSFSIPVGTTCPGKSEWCAASCYAKAGHFTFPQNVRKYEANLVALMQPDFVALMVKEIREANVRDFRIHVSGDFMSPFAVRKWIEIAKTLPGVSFWAYTRSWRLGGAMLRSLNELRALPNVGLYASWDDSTKDEPPEGWVVARSGDIAQIGIGILCPNQTSGGKVKCSSCRLCIEGKKDVTFIKHR